MSVVNGSKFFMQKVPPTKLDLVPSQVRKIKILGLLSYLAKEHITIKLF